jgi:hypothetical protein
MSGTAATTPSHTASLTAHPIPGQLISCPLSSTHPPDRLLQLHLPERPGSARTCIPRAQLGTLLPQLLDQLEAQAAAGALVAIDRGAQEHQVGAQQGLDGGQGDGGSLIDDQQLRLSQLGGVARLDVLHRLAVVPSGWRQGVGVVWR